MAKLKALTVFLALVWLNQPVFAQDMDAEELTPEQEQDQGKPINSYKMMTMGQVSPKSLAFLAEDKLRSGNVDEAIHLLKQSLSMDNDDADAHALYAEALERKLRKQDEKDPELFNKCVREWLLVLRNEVGEEKGLNVKGVGVPLMQTFYRDEDHNILAKNHLVKLTGSGPKPWETNTKYLKRVLQKPSETVAGKVVVTKPKAETDIKKDQYDYDEDPIANRSAGQKKHDAKVVQQRETDIEMEK
jgi:hypothetical protein